MFLNNKTTKESETEHWHLKSLNLYPLLRRALRITDQRGLDWNLNPGGQGGWGGLEMLECFIHFLLSLLLPSNSRFQAPIRPAPPLTKT